MTRWFRRPGSWAVLSVCLLAGAGQAQQIGAPFRPQVNPFPTIPPAINMRGPNPVTGYFGIVRPQQATNQALQHLQNDFALQQMLNPLGDPQAQGQGNLTTSNSGHGVSFFNTRQYFSGPNNRYSLGGAGGQGGQAGGNFNQANHATGVPLATGLNMRR